jgi:hypothetical protein
MNIEFQALQTLNKKKRLQKVVIKRASHLRRRLRLMKITDCSILTGIALSFPTQKYVFNQLSDIIINDL